MIVIKIRLFEAQDAEQIARLFHETVREVNVRNYSSNQVRVWAPDDIYFRNWVEVCSNRFTYVADDEGVIAGFGEVETNGHIDCFYCHKNYQRCGVGRQIYRAIEAKAVELPVRVVLQKLVEDRKLLGKEVSYAAAPKISAMNLTRSVTAPFTTP